MRKISKVFALALSAALVLGLAACGGNGTDGTTTGSTGGTTGSTEAKNAKTGLAISTGVGSSKEDKGLAQVDSTAVAVLLNADGTIADIEIDTVQVKVNFDTAGKITTALDTVFKTKTELGPDYGMKGASEIGKEWDEQITALEEFAIGKTVADVTGISVDEDGYPGEDADGLTGVTMKISGYLSTLEAAAESAKELGAKEGDTLSLGVEASIARSKSVGEDTRAPEVGKVEAYNFYTALTFNEDDVITSAIVDASQGAVEFDGSGKITTDLATAYDSKNVLGDDYGMKGASEIGKEWYEQAAGFAEYITGKTVEEVSGIAMEDGYATDADLLATTTVHINDMISVVEKAEANRG